MTPLSCCALWLAAVAAQAASAPAPRLVGWIEEARLQPHDVALAAKLDTGADTSSLHAEALRRFERDGRPWIRFVVEVDDLHGRRVRHEFERPLLRTVAVRGAGGSERRPVVRMSVCVGDRLLDEPFTLNDRDDMRYPLLLGRRTLQALGVVDVTRTFTLRAACGGGGAAGAALGAR